jgi:hypothetical protein
VVLLLLIAHLAREAVVVGCHSVLAIVSGADLGTPDKTGYRRTTCEHLISIDAVAYPTPSGSEQPPHSRHSGLDRGKGNLVPFPGRRQRGD